MIRQAHLARLRTQSFDVLVIGGGITGAGVALEAAARGLGVALIERGDFAQGTSSRSTKLIHGGLRYLPMLDIAQVREGLEEQNALFRNAPHLVRPAPFLVPLYRGARHPLGLSLPVPLRAALPAGVGAGLWAYDVLAGRRGRYRHRQLSPEEAAARVPHLRRDGLRSAYLFYDGLTDDARLTLAVLQTAVRLGACVANYLEATGLVVEAGRVAGARLTDRLSGERVTVRARKTINATGVWAEEVARLAGPPPSFRIRRAKGVHLIVPRDRLGMGRTALVLPETDDGRIAFIVPWQGALIVGTTDTEWDRPENEPEILQDDVAYLLDHASRFLAVPLTLRDVQSAFAGLRPLVSAGAAASARLSRRHEVVPSVPGFYSIIGGKLTTFRRMAEAVVNVATARRAGTPSRTRTLRLAGAEGLADALLVLRARARRLGVSPATLRHLIRARGTAAAAVLDCVEEHPPWGAPLCRGWPIIGAEVVVAVRDEMAVTLADVLLRRTRLGLLLPGRGTEIASEVAGVMGDALGWSPDARSAQVAEYARTASRFVPGKTLPEPPRTIT